MNTQEFVIAIKIAVYEAAAKGVIETLRKPAGRRPDPEAIELSHWFNGLKQQDRDSVARVADLAADQATYKFLSVLDGILAVEPKGPKGSLELIYDNGQTRARLNDHRTEQLTFLFKQRS